MSTESETMTLAFDLEAIDRLAEPGAAFTGAKGWAEHVGVIFDGMAYQVINYLRDRGVYDEDFFSRLDRERSLEFAREEAETDRYVLVGTDDDDAALADATGWEYLDVAEAAEAADWTLRETDASSDADLNSPATS